MKAEKGIYRQPVAESRVLLYLSIYLTLFFSWVLAVNLGKWEATIIGVFWELLMLPSLVGLVVVTGYTAFRWLRTGFGTVPGPQNTGKAASGLSYHWILLMLLLPWGIIGWLSFVS